jgi:hypothetical protein
MPVHDWTRVDAGIFHDFHHAWIEEIKRALNGGLLPIHYYALVERHAADVGPDVVTGPPGVLPPPPWIPLTAGTDLSFYPHEQNSVVVRHVSGDRVVAMVEVVSPGNKASRNALRSFVEKAAGLLDRRVHLLILDLHPPGKRDPNGIHGAIWEEVAGAEFEAPAGKPLTLVAYEAGPSVAAYVEPLAVGDPLLGMPLFLEPGRYTHVPLEATYQAAFAAVPRRWRDVLEG